MPLSSKKKLEKAQKSAKSRFRSAAQPALVGFLYQFQCFVLEILSAKPDDIFTFEAEYDLEIKSIRDSNRLHRIISYKYLPSKSLCASTVRWPILDLLLGVKRTAELKGTAGLKGTGNREQRTVGERSKELSFLLLNPTVSCSPSPVHQSPELHIYVPSTTNFSIATIDDIKSLGVYSDNGRERDHIKEFGITDDELREFLDGFRLIIGESIEATYEKVIRALTRRFATTIQLAEEYYYPKAIERCLKLATSPSSEDHIVTAKQFLKSISRGIQSPIQKSMSPQRLTGIGLLKAQRLLSQKPDASHLLTKPHPTSPSQERRFY